MKIAFLIGSQLRYLEQNMKIFSNNLINCEYDVFVYTNKKYEPWIKYIKNLRAVKYVEDNEDDIAVEKKISLVKKDCNIYQWFKLKNCFELLEKYRTKNNINYDIICKLRTDYSYTNPINFTRNAITKHLYMESDRYFYGNYETMKIACNFYDMIYERYYGKGKQRMYYDINYEGILKSDTTAGNFALFNYPQKIVDNAKNPYSLKKSILQNLQILKNYKYCEGDQLCTAIPKGRNFRTEKNFYHYILSENIIGKRSSTPGRLLNKRCKIPGYLSPITLEQQQKSK